MPGGRSGGALAGSRLQASTSDCGPAASFSSISHDLIPTIGQGDGLADIPVILVGKLFTSHHWRLRPFRIDFPTWCPNGKRGQRIFQHASLNPTDADYDPQDEALLRYLTDQAEAFDLPPVEEPPTRFLLPPTHFGVDSALETGILGWGLGGHSSSQQFYSSHQHQQQQQHSWNAPVPEYSPHNPAPTFSSSPHYQVPPHQQTYYAPAHALPQSQHDFPYAFLRDRPTVPISSTSDYPYAGLDNSLPLPLSLPGPSHLNIPTSPPTTTAGYSTPTRTPNSHPTTSTSVPTSTSTPRSPSTPRPPSPSFIPLVSLGSTNRLLASTLPAPLSAGPGRKAPLPKKNFSTLSASTSTKSAALQGKGKGREKGGPLELSGSCYHCGEPIAKLVLRHAKWVGDLEDLGARATLRCPACLTPNTQEKESEEGQESKEGERKEEGKKRKEASYKDTFSAAIDMLEGLTIEDEDLVLRRARDELEEGGGKGIQSGEPIACESVFSCIRTPYSLVMGGKVDRD
ncbi:hypothetical protein P7C70_g5208, partial [Phenoliferia sp. Uapishka_3]